MSADVTPGVSVVIDPGQPVDSTDSIRAALDAAPLPESVKAEIQAALDAAEGTA